MKVTSGMIGGKITLLLAAFILASAPFSKDAAAADEWKSVCEPVLKSAKSLSEKELHTLGNRLTYCQAAESAKKGAGTHSALWKVWAGVATVCTTACATSVAGAFHQPLVCMGATTAGGLTQGILTREFTNALLTIAMTTGGSYMVNKLTAPEKVKASAEGEATKNAKKPKDYGACLMAAAATAKAFGSRSAMNSEKDSYKQNLANAAELGSDVATLGPSFGIQEGATQGSTDGSNSANPSSVDSCSSLATSGQISSLNTIECATGTDPQLPAFVKRPEFEDELRNLTGNTLAQFDSGNGAESLGSAMAASFSDANQKEAVKKLAGLAEEHVSKGFGVEGTAYHARRGQRGGSSGGDGFPDINSMMNQMMSKIFGEETSGSGKSTGSQATLSQYSQRQPAATSATLNERDSLFKRITHRYRLLDIGELTETSGGQ